MSVRYETRTDGYERWRLWEGGADRYYYVHRLVAVAEFGVEAVKDHDVHHVNGIEWDNRPENLEPRQPTRHARYHLHES